MCWLELTKMKLIACLGHLCFILAELKPYHLCVGCPYCKQILCRSLDPKFLGDDIFVFSTVQHLGNNYDGGNMHDISTNNVASNSFFCMINSVHSRKIPLTIYNSIEGSELVCHLLDSAQALDRTRTRQEMHTRIFPVLSDKMNLNVFENIVDSSAFSVMPLYSQKIFFVLTVVTGPEEKATFCFLYFNINIHYALSIYCQLQFIKVFSELTKYAEAAVGFIFKIGVHTALVG